MQILWVQQGSGNPALVTPTSPKNMAKASDGGCPHHANPLVKTGHAGLSPGTPALSHIPCSGGGETLSMELKWAPNE